MTTASADPLDILYIGSLPPQPGGSAIVSAALLPRLAARGHRVRAMAPITVEGAAVRADLVACMPDVHVTSFYVPHFDTSPSVRSDDAYVQAERDAIGKTLSTMLDERRPDVVCIGRETFAHHVPEMTRRASVPSLMVVHGNPTHQLVQGSSPEPHAARLLAQYRRVDRIATPARHMAAALGRIGFREVAVIPNGIDLDRFAPRPKDHVLLAELGIADARVVVMHASKFVEGKRADDVVRSAEHVLPRCPYVAYLIVGDGVQRGPAEKACRRRGLADGVRFVGWVDHHDMPRYVNLADVVVVPSDVETQPLAYLETQACARLLIASDILAAREFVVDGETGLLFRKGDVDDLAAKTVQAVRNPELRCRIGRKAAASVRAYDLDIMTMRYEDLLRTVARRRRPFPLRPGVR